MIEVAMANISRVVPVLAVLRLVAKTTMGFSDLAKTTRSLARIVPRAILEESQVLGKAVPGRVPAVNTEMITKVLPVAADRVRESAVAVEDEQTISNELAWREHQMKILSYLLLKSSSLFISVISKNRY